jgi:PilZ domain
MVAAIETFGRTSLMTTESIAKKRQGARDSLFLTTEVTVEGARKAVTVRVRNLSPGGMMIDGNAVFHEGAVVSANLRGIGSVSGKIAWIVEDRAGVSFDDEIDPKEARAPVAAVKPNILFTPTVDKSRRPGLKIR